MENLVRNEQERVDNLHIKGYQIIQNIDHFRYGTDAVLLSWYVACKVYSKSHIIDIGTGTGIIPILLAANNVGESIDALEIQDYYADLARRNIKLNKLDHKINVFYGDMRFLPEEIIRNKYDAVISNPPYMRESIHNSNKALAIARHEITWSMEEFMKSASRIMKDKGKCILIHRADRIVDIFYHMRLNHIEPKSMRLIYPKRGKNANLVLVEGAKNGKPQLTVEESLIIYGEDGKYTDELLRIYYG